MKPYQAQNRRVRSYRETRCVNPHCGKWVELYREKVCPNCGKRFTERTDQKRCDDCQAFLVEGDSVCPLCGSKQRATVELRSIHPENLTAFTHLLHEGQPHLSLAECRKQCRSITTESPYRLSFSRHPEQIQPLIRKWNELGGTAKACLDRETSQRPIVLIRSYNRRRETEHAHLLYRAIQQSEHSSLSFGETVRILHRINQEEQPIRLVFSSGLDQIDSWVEEWRSLGGTAARSSEHQAARNPDDFF